MRTRKLFMSIVGSLLLIPGFLGISTLLRSCSFEYSIGMGARLGRGFLGFVLGAIVYSLVQMFRIVSAGDLSTWDVELDDIKKNNTPGDNADVGDMLLLIALIVLNVFPLEFLWSWNRWTYGYGTALLILYPITLETCIHKLKQEKSLVASVIWILCLMLGCLRLEWMIGRGVLSAVEVSFSIVLNLMVLSFTFFRHFVSDTSAATRRKMILSAVGILGIGAVVWLWIYDGSFVSISVADRITNWTHNSWDMWKNAAMFGMSSRLQTPEIYHFLVNNPSVIHQILFYSGRVPVLLFCIAQIVCMKCTWGMLAPQNYKMYHDQSLSFAAAMWLILRFGMGLLSGVGLVPWSIQLPWTGSYVGVDGMAYGILLAAALISNWKIAEIQDMNLIRAEELLGEGEFYSVIPVNCEQEDVRDETEMTAKKEKEPSVFHEFNELIHQKLPSAKHRSWIKELLADDEWLDMDEDVDDDKSADAEDAAADLATEDLGNVYDFENDPEFCQVHGDGTQVNCSKYTVEHNSEHYGIFTCTAAGKSSVFFLQQMEDERWTAVTDKDTRLELFRFFRQFMFDKSLGDCYDAKSAWMKEVR